METAHPRNFDGRECLHLPYTVNMARGWESKSVENQIDLATQKSDHQESVHAANSRKGEEKNSRERELLRLARSNITQKLDATENPRYRKQLTDALAEIDSQIAALDARK